jgi:hypothetical protein
MASENDELDDSIDDVQKPGDDSKCDIVLDSSAEKAPVATPNSSSSDELLQPSPALQHRPKVSPEKRTRARLMRDIEGVSMDKVIIEVRVPVPERPWEYLRIPEEDIVEVVIEETEHPGNELWYKIAYADGREADVSYIRPR